MIGVLAKNRHIAREAKKHVKITYKPLPPILTLEVCNDLSNISLDIDPDFSMSSQSSS